MHNAHSHTLRQTIALVRCHVPLIIYHVLLTKMNCVFFGLWQRLMKVATSSFPPPPLPPPPTPPPLPSPRINKPGGFQQFGLFVFFEIYIRLHTEQYNAVLRKGNRVKHYRVPHCKENPIYLFLFWELRGLCSN
jgi:hypothetical protein